MRAFFLACLCIGASAAMADEYDLSGMISPGLWETTTQQVSPDGETGPPETDRDCITAADIQDFSSFVRGGDDQTVTVEQFERGDDYVRYRMRFASDDPDMDIKGTMSGDMKFQTKERYRGTMSFTMSFQDQSFESTTRIDAHRIGECRGDDAGG